MILENPNATTLCSALVSFFIPVIISVIIYLGQGYEKKPRHKRLAWRPQWHLVSVRFFEAENLDWRLFRVSELNREILPYRKRSQSKFSVSTSLTETKWHPRPGLYQQPLPELQEATKSGVPSDVMIWRHKQVLSRSRRCTIKIPPPLLIGHKI